MRILAIGAHPDDVEICCGGTLAKYAQAGHHVTMCYACKGDLGNYTLSREETAILRAKEAEDSARVIGADLVALGIDDLGLRAEDPAQQLLFVDLIRRSRPDVAITHAPGEWHTDHLAVSKLLFYAAFAAGFPHFKTAHEPYANVLPIFYMDPLGGQDFTPTEYVDITDTVAVKKRMMSQHHSQLSFLKEYFGLDPLEQIETVGKFRGLQAGVPYAEGFMRYLGFGRGKLTERLLP